MMILIVLVVAACLCLGMTPLSGKVARLQSVIAGPLTVAHEFEDWTMSLKSDMIEANGFEKTADADANYWNTYLVGLNSGEAHFGGLWNTSKTPTASFKPGAAYAYTSLFCGISTSSTVGFTLTGKCSNIEASTQVKQAGKFKGTFQIEGVTTYPT